MTTLYRCSWFDKKMDAKEIKVYVFSMGSDPYTEDFAEVLDQ